MRNLWKTFKDFRVDNSLIKEYLMQAMSDYMYGIWYLKVYEHLINLLSIIPQHRILYYNLYSEVQ